MTLVMPSLEKAAERISVFEGFRARPYLDSVGVATIGYGTTHYPDGRAVTLTDTQITEIAAIAFLEHDLEATARGIWKYLTRQPTLNQWSALVSLAYNVGVGAISRSTVLRLFNKGEISEAGHHFLDWNKGHINGELVPIKGLANRRQAEAMLFLTPDEEN